MATIKIRAKMKNDVCEFKALLKHPMETGLRMNKKTGKKIPAHYIREVECKHNGKSVMTSSWGGAISTNPYLSVRFAGAKKGDSISFNWVDNKGNSDSSETKIS